MNNQLKKILSVVLILSLINWIFAFADEEFVSEMSIIEIKNNKTWDNIKDFSIWDVIKTEKNSISFNYNQKLKIKISENSEFKFNNFNLWELINWQAKISSISDYSVEIWKIKINLKDSWVFVDKNESEIKILSEYWINEIIFNWKKNFLLAWNQIIISWEKISFEKKDVKNNDKIFTEDKEFLFNNLWWNNWIWKFLWNLVFFENKNIENISSEEKNIFNSCIEAISELTKKEKEWFKNIARFYKNVEQKCINKEILKNDDFSEKFEENFENISSLKEKYFIDEKRKNFLWEKFSFIENIFYLQKNISSADLKNFSYFLDNSKKSFESENNLKNLEIWFILIDWILKNNLKFSFEKIYDFRNKISEKILANILEKIENWNEDYNKYISKIEKNISVNLNFIENLLENKNFKELDYIFANKIIYKNSKNDENLKNILVDYDKSFDDYSKILDSSKNILHWSADENKKIEEIKKAEKEKQEKEAEIKKLLDSFKIVNIKDVEITTKDQKDEIVKIFNKYWFTVKQENIECFMEWWNLFYVNWVEFLAKKYDLVFDLSNEIVSKMKSVWWNEFEWNWAMELSVFKNLVSTENFKVSTFDERPSNVFQNLEKKDFSHENFLKKELVRKYLLSVWVIVDAKNILKIDWENFLVKNSKIEKYSDLNIWFKIKLIDWTISWISFWEDFFETYLDENLEKNIKKIKLARNLKLKIENFYWNSLLRKENFIKVLSNLAWLWIKKWDIFLWEGLVDWFKVYKWLEMSSWNWILSWEYIVSTNTFASAKFTLWEHFEDFTDISTSKLIERIKFINKNINDLEKLKTEEELRIMKEQQRLEKIRILNYWNSVPDELLDWAWITD